MSFEVQECVNDRTLCGVLFQDTGPGEISYGYLWKFRRGKRGL